MKKAPDCCSEKIIKNTIVPDRGDGNSNHYLRIAIDENPDALIFKQRSYSDVCAEACAARGSIVFSREKSRNSLGRLPKSGSQ